MASAVPGTDAARQEVLSAREALLEEVVRLEAAGRAAVDVKAKIRRSPGKAAVLVGGASFLAAGGPKRVVRGIKRVVRGPAPATPSSMLPHEIEKVVRSLGDDGDRVRGVLEREFAAYLVSNRKTGRRFWRNPVFTAVVMPIGSRIAKAAASRILRPDEQRFAEWTERIRARQVGGSSAAGSSPSEVSSAGKGGPTR